MFVSETVAHAEIGLLHICANIERYSSIELVLQTWGRQHGIEHPLGRHFPANSGSGNDRILSFDIDTNTEDDLQIGAVNVGAADYERKIEIVRQMTEPCIVNARLGFDSDQDRIRQLRV